MPRTVIVTGAGSGIGAAIARGFAAQGDLVVMADLSETRLAETRSAIESADVRTRRLDVSELGAFEDLAASVIAETGRIDVLVNNAGVTDGFSDIHETSSALWSRVIGINLGGCFHGAKAVARHMTDNGYGRIVNISSVAASRSWGNGVAYDASKAGIEGLTRRLALELGPSGVTVNAIAPGVVGTNARINSREILDEAIHIDRGFTKFPELLNVFIPAHRKGEPADVAAAATFLASDAASYINGVVLPVDGGWMAT